MKTFTTTQLINYMTNLVARYVKHYRTDFTDYDVPEIRKIGDNADKANYLWFVRKSGTYFIDLDADGGKGITFLHTIREHYSEYREYTVTFDGCTWTIKKTGGKEAA